MLTMPKLYISSTLGVHSVNYYFGAEGKASKADTALTL